MSVPLRKRGWRPDCSHRYTNATVYIVEHVMKCECVTYHAKSRASGSFVREYRIACELAVSEVHRPALSSGLRTRINRRGSRMKNKSDKLGKSKSDKYIGKSRSEYFIGSLRVTHAIGQGSGAIHFSASPANTRIADPELA